jgi:hypothetical protein
VSHAGRFAPALDWVKLAETQGVPASRATSAEEFQKQFEAAISNYKTAIVGGDHALLELVMATHTGMTTAEFDDKGGKPVGIHQHIGRRPIAAFGNSDGDLQMLEYTAAGRGARFCLYVHHDDAEREYAYDRKDALARLDQGLDEAAARGWTVVSMTNDWKTVFPALPTEISAMDILPRQDFRPPASVTARSRSWRRNSRIKVTFV